MRELFLNLGLAFIPVSVVLTALWLSARSRALRAEETIRAIALAARPSLAHPHSPLTPPLAEVTAVLEDLALDVERIAEGQRFTTRLLAERQNPDSLGMGRSITPH